MKKNESGKNRSGLSGRSTGDRFRAWLQKDAREVASGLRERVRGAAPPGAGRETQVPGDAARDAMPPVPGKSTGGGSALKSGQTGRVESAVTAGAPAKAPLTGQPPNAGVKGKERLVISGAQVGAGGWVAGIRWRVDAWWRGFRDFVISLGHRFPVVMVQTERFDAMPSFKSVWHLLLLSAAAGWVAWTTSTALLQRRVWWVSLVAAVLVSVGVVLSLGTRFGAPVGFFAMGVALVSLLAGEVTVQMLYRLGIIGSLDLDRLGRAALEGGMAFYRSFFFSLVVYRLLPPAVLAFLVGFWPLPLRPHWRGFGENQG